MSTHTEILVMAMGIAFPWVGVQASQPSTDGHKTEAVDQGILAAKAQRTGDLLLAPVKSPLDLAVYLHASHATPLDALSPAARSRFLNSLSFNENGLTGFDYTDLRAELTATQIYRILAIFGAQRLTPRVVGARAETDVDHLLMTLPASTTDPAMSDYMEYRCVSPHTCAESPRHICMSGC